MAVSANKVTWCKQSPAGVRHCGLAGLTRWSAVSGNCPFKKKKLRQFIWWTSQIKLETAKPTVCLLNKEKARAVCFEMLAMFRRWLSTSLLSLNSLSSWICSMGGEQWLLMVCEIKQLMTVFNNQIYFFFCSNSSFNTHNDFKKCQMVSINHLPRLFWLRYFQSVEGLSASVACSDVKTTIGSLNQAGDRLLTKKAFTLP